MGMHEDAWGCQSLGVFPFFIGQVLAGNLQDVHIIFWPCISCGQVFSRFFLVWWLQTCIGVVGHFLTLQVYITNNSGKVKIFWQTSCLQHPATSHNIPATSCNIPQHPAMSHNILQHSTTSCKIAATSHNIPQDIYTIGVVLVVVCGVWLLSIVTNSGKLQPVFFLATSNCAQEIALFCVHLTVMCLLRIHSALRSQHNLHKLENGHCLTRPIIRCCLTHAFEFDTEGCTGWWGELIYKKVADWCRWQGNTRK